MDGIVVVQAQVSHAVSERDELVPVDPFPAVQVRLSRLNAIGQIRIGHAVQILTGQTITQSPEFGDQLLGRLVEEGGQQEELGGLDGETPGRLHDAALPQDHVLAAGGEGPADRRPLLERDPGRAAGRGGHFFGLRTWIPSAVTCRIMADSAACRLTPYEVDYT